MPKIRGYVCTCGEHFEHMHMREDDLAACPVCKRQVTDDDEVLGGTLFETIIPMHRTSLKHKAGFVHTHGDRPAEKTSVAVPRNKGDM